MNLAFYHSLAQVSWKQLLHQPLLVGFQGVEFFRFSGDLGVEGGEAVGNLLLLGEICWRENSKF